MSQNLTEYLHSLLSQISSLNQQIIAMEKQALELPMAFELNKVELAKNVSQKLEQQGYQPKGFGFNMPSSDTQIQISNSEIITALNNFFKV